MKFFNKEDRKSMNEATYFGSVNRLRFAILKCKQTVYKEHNCILAWIIMYKLMKYINLKFRPIIMETWNENDNWIKNKKL